MSRTCVANCQGWLHYPKNPPLNLGSLALMRVKFRAEELFVAAVPVCPSQPFGCRICVLLVGCSSSTREGPAPQRRIDLRDYGAVGRYAPTIIWPEVNAVPDVL